MTLQKHITNICRSVNIHIRKINSIRSYLSDTTVINLVQSIVIARLDYCNSVCIGLPMNRLQRIQLVQNSAARVIIKMFRLCWNLQFCKDLKIKITPFPSIGLGRRTTTTTHVISQTKRYTSITPILNELHWLPINKRCQFKILLLTFKSLNDCAPEYICDILNVYMPNRS